MTDEAVLTWEITRWGDLKVTKADETGEMMMCLGPIAEVLETLRDFLAIAHSPDRNSESGDAKQAPSVG